MAPANVETEEPSVAVLRPAAGVRPAPLVFANPHSGRVYPAEMMAASALDAEAIRCSEDAYVDALIASAPSRGAVVVAASLARAYIDVNREPWELDASMFEDELPVFARARTARVAAGLGSIARVVSEGREIYARKLRFDEAARRVERGHRPYHEALTSALGEVRREHGLAVLIDWHSMPAAAAKAGLLGRERCDFVLGDRFGGSCAPALTRLVERELESMGYLVARNAPYAGGYTTEHYGRPAGGVHALQIEINRALYVDEASLQPTEGFEPLRGDLDRLFAALAGVDWRRVVG
jgi:N-formylglutamate amidohydrolase